MSRFEWRARPAAGRLVLAAWAALLCLGGALTAQQPGRFRASADVVHHGVTVTDRRGGLVAGLTMADFAVYEDGVLQPLAYFASGDALAAGVELHAAVLLDVSQSMGGDIAFTKTAAIRFLDSLPEAVDLTVVDFDTEVRVGRFSQREFPRVVERIRQQGTRGSTSLYDAVALYLDGAAAQAGRKVMVLYTDGGDTRSAIRFGDLLEELRASDVTVYSVGALDHQAPSSRLAQQQVLRRIAEATGGLAFFPRSDDALDRAYRQIVAEIRGQYLLGYHPATRAEGRWREVEIKVVAPRGRDYRVRSRDRYFW